MVLHHEKLVCYDEHTRLLNSGLVLKTLIKTDPLRIKIFTFLSEGNHSWVENTILGSDGALYIKECDMMMSDISLRPLKSLVTTPGFFLKHLVQLFSTTGFFWTLRSLFLNTKFLGNGLNHCFGLIVIILIKTVVIVIISGL